MITALHATQTGASSFLKIIDGAWGTVTKTILIFTHLYGLHSQKILVSLYSANMLDQTPAVVISDIFFSGIINANLDALSVC